MQSAATASILIFFCHLRPVNARRRGRRLRNPVVVGVCWDSVDVDSVDTPETDYPPAALTIARMPARIASGSVGQASMIAARAGSMAVDSGASAPDFAPPCPKST